MREIQNTKAKGSIMSEQNDKKQIDPETIGVEFEEFLKEKGYDLSIKTETRYEADEPDGVDDRRKIKRKIRRISEELNDDVFDDLMYTDTTKLVPGMVVYVIEEYDTKPVVTYKPAARIIDSIHNNGVNNGTVFMTRVPKFINNPDFKGFSSKNKEHEYLVTSEEEIIYSPLTKEQADRMCSLYNFQFKEAYKKGMKKVSANLKVAKEAAKKIEGIKRRNAVETKKVNGK